ncbi:hypothetical protein [Streptomyces sp. NPDC006446]|uniref:hypothetical protein n=1 Tax=Streptomyces sp. NPDC006446 TaxID=3154301 RepID=UPI0033B9A0E8
MTAAFAELNKARRTFQPRWLSTVRSVASALVVSATVTREDARVPRNLPGTRLRNGSPTTRTIALRASISRTRTQFTSE